MTPQVSSEPRLTVANNLRGDGRNGTKADNGEEGCEHDPLCHGFLRCQTFGPSRAFAHESVTPVTFLSGN